MVDWATHDSERQLVAARKGVVTVYAPLAKNRLTKRVKFDLEARTPWKQAGVIPDFPCNPHGLCGFCRRSGTFCAWSTGQMVRRRKDDDVAGIVAQLVGLVLLVGFISPQGRQMLSAFGVLAFGFLGIAFVSLIAFVIHRIATRSKRLQVTSANPFTAKLAAAIPTAAGTPQNPIAFAPAVRGGATIAEAPGSTADLIEQLRSIDWFQFEKIVALAYRKQGYTATRRGGANPDGGIDLVIRKDGETKAVQCKQWKTWNVGVKAVREFLGALTDAGIQRGIFITLRGYTGEAKQLADKHGIEIVNETGLAAMLEATDARFDPEVLDILRDTRKFCPKCEYEMVRRPARRGPNAGKSFWGCSKYPRCKFTLPIAE